MAEEVETKQVAVVRRGVVENVVLVAVDADGRHAWTPPTGAKAVDVPADVVVSPGSTYKGGVFGPPPNPEPAPAPPSPDAEAAATLHAALKAARASSATTVAALNAKIDAAIDALLGTRTDAVVAGRPKEQA